MKDVVEVNGKVCEQCKAIIHGLALRRHHDGREMYFCIFPTSKSSACYDTFIAVRKLFRR